MSKKTGTGVVDGSAKLPELHDLLLPLVEKYRDKNGAHYDRVTEFIEKIEQLDQRLKVGEDAKNFVLPDQSGNLISLKSVFATGVTLLTFLRGGWCPYCDAQVEALSSWHPKFVEAGINLVVVTPEVGGRSKQLAERHSAPFPVLCDVESLVAFSYGCLFALPPQEQEFLKMIGYDMAEIYGTSSWFMPTSTSFGIGRDGKIIQQFGVADPRKRPEPREILQALIESDVGF